MANHLCVEYFSDRERGRWACPLSTRAVRCLQRIGIGYPPKRAEVRRALPILRAGITSDLGDPRCVRHLGPKTLAEIERWLEGR